MGLFFVTFELILCRQLPVLLVSVVIAGACWELFNL